MTGPTIGHMEIVCDESLKFIIEQEEQIFERTYKYASLDIMYLSAFDVFSQFFLDSIDAIITTRSLTPDELKQLEQRQIYPRQYPFATSALAFIQQKSDQDPHYVYEEMISLLRNENGGKQFVIENAKSGIAIEIMDILGVTELPKHIFALAGKDEILDYVSLKQNAIGIIDWSDISDSDDAYSKSFLERIDLIGVSIPDETNPKDFVKPFQYDLQDNKYPFTRDLFLISKSGMHDVGTGFAFFISGDIGQKIILKAGLLPKFQTERTIELKTISDINVIK